MKNSIKKIYFLVFLILSVSNVFSQERKLEITDIESEKIKYIYENKKVVLKTVSGEKYKGKMFFIGENSIQIKENTILLEDIFSIKKNPLGISIAKTTLLVIGGVVFVSGAVILVAGMGGIEAFAGGVLMLSSIVPTASYLILNASNKTHTNSDFTYKIILE